MATTLVTGPVGCLPMLLGGRPDGTATGRAGLAGLIGLAGNGGFKGAFAYGDGAAGGLPVLGGVGRSDFGLGIEGVGGLRAELIFFLDG